jgi:hypothetical protein
MQLSSSSSVGTFPTNYEMSHPGPLLMSSIIPYMKTLTRIGTLSGKLELTLKARPVGWLKT